MADLLTPLYGKLGAKRKGCSEDGIIVRRVLAPESQLVVNWIREHFGEGWGSEAAVAAGKSPATVWIAVRGQELLGFACFDAVAKGFFGPTGVLERERGKGLGEELLFTVLEDMRAAGYGYAVIGGVGPKEFYEKHLTVFEIPDSAPGIYKGLLKQSE